MELETWLRFMYRLVKVDRTSNFCMQASACSINIYKAFLIWPSSLPEDNLANN